MINFGFQNCRYSKLEKADILEMTVGFLKEIPTSSPKGKYRTYLPSMPHHIFNYFKKSSKLNISLTIFVNILDQSESFNEGYKACLQRVSTLIPKINLDKEACQRVNNFISQSAPVAACQNCCAQSSRILPQIQQRLSVKPSLPIGDRQGVIAPLPSRPQPAPQSANVCMWRPW